LAAENGALQTGTYRCRIFELPQVAICGSEDVNIF
jgi:hypothetical protein